MRVSDGEGAQGPGSFKRNMVSLLIQISKEYYTVNKKGDYWYCNGTIHNISGATHYYVKAKVTYMDKNKTVLTTDWIYAVGSEGIKGGENQQFEIMTKVYGDMQYYKCEILEWD